MAKELVTRVFLTRRRSQAQRLCSTSSPSPPSSYAQPAWSPARRGQVLNKPTPILRLGFGLLIVGEFGEDEREEMHQDGSI
jgi:hypothetical protein